MDSFKVFTAKKPPVSEYWCHGMCFMNQNFYFAAVGSAYGTREDRRIKYNGNANLRAGTNKIALLSVACGLPVSPIINLNLYLLIL
jgi:hypothetical protein